MISALFDEENEFFVKELVIAIKAWEYFYLKGNLKSSKGHASQFKEWIEENYRYSGSADHNCLLENLPVDSIEKIATIANKDPRKQRKPTQIKKGEQKFTFFHSE